MKQLSMPIDNVPVSTKPIVVIKERPRAIVYTDGSCSVHSTKRAGWCAIILGDRKEVLRGGFDNGTNNVAECVAVRQAIVSLGKPTDILVHTDSKDVIGWLFGWNVKMNKPDNTKRWKRKNIRIAMICKEIDDLVYAGNHRLEFEWVAGHSGNELNEQCDRIAREEAERGLQNV